MADLAIQPTARLMLWVFRAFEDQLAQKLKEKGFSNVKPSHFNILRHLNDEGMRQIDLAADAGITKQAVGKMIGELVKAGFVELTDDAADGRAKRVIYTTQGKHLIDESVVVVKNLEREMSEVLGIDDYAQLRTSLVELLSHFRTKAVDDE
jgi:DNA-binding MarR family transcriptional regulator